MPIIRSVVCAACYAENVERPPEEQRPALAMGGEPLFGVNRDGKPGVIDLCEEHRATLWEPLMAVTDAWLRDTYTPQDAKDAKSAGRRGWTGGAKQAPEPLPDKRKGTASGSPAAHAIQDFGAKYPCVVLTCEQGYPEGQSHRLRQHITREHASHALATVLDTVTLCGFCDPPKPFDSSAALAVHTNRMHKSPSLAAHVRAILLDGDRLGTIRDALGASTAESYQDSLLPA